MKMTLKESIVKSKEVRKDGDFANKMNSNDISVVYHASVLFGSQLDRSNNDILMNRNAVPKRWNFDPHLSDNNINFAFKEAYSQEVEYLKQPFDITPGRVLKLLDILLLRAPKIVKIRRLHIKNESLRRYLKNLNDLRMRYEEMTDSEIYDFSFDMVYDLIDELSFSSETLLLSLLIMYWIQRENHLIPLALNCDKDAFLSLLDTQVEDIAGKKEARKEFRLFMRKVLDLHLKEFLKSNDGNKKGTSRDRILDLIKSNPKHTAKTMASCLGLSVQAVQKQIAVLKTEGRLQRIGPDNGGMWKVTER